MNDEAREWDAARLFPTGEDKRVASYRRLQSWYRETVLAARPGAFGRYAELGSYLHADDVARRPGLNFLTEAAWRHAQDRIVAVKSENGALDPVRLQHNMLSSMPLCFNLFGALRVEADFLTLFQELFDPDAVAIDDVVCEWAPQPTKDFLGDRTAFDAVVFYKTGKGARFCGIETKYTEPFSATEYTSPRYDEVTRSSGWFTDPEAASEELRRPRSNQLWRNVMLAAAVEERGGHGSGWVAVVALADDPGAAKALSAVQGALSDPRRLRGVPLESIATAAVGIDSLRDWAEAFRVRYVGPIPD